MGREFTMKGKSKKGDFGAYTKQYSESAAASKTGSSKASGTYMGMQRGPGMSGTRPPRPKQGSRKSGEVGGM
jgi:hypothetical protein